MYTSMSSLPEAFVPSVYRELYEDLQSLDIGQLRHHWHAHGQREGRRSHTIRNRNEFAQLALTESCLEIGPFAAPLVRGPGVTYADIWTTAQLKDLARAEGLEVDQVPEIDWVVEPCDLGSIQGKYDSILSSHSIEHQPNLVKHFQQISHLLKQGGRYFLLVPDCRYSFDHFKPISTSIDVLNAMISKREFHEPKSILLNICLMTHNDPIRHWAGDHGSPGSNPAFPNASHRDLLREALRYVKDDASALRDGHAWCFMPETFSEIVKDLFGLGIIDLTIERTYPTLHNSLEFWTVLTKVTQ